MSSSSSSLSGVSREEFFLFHSIDRELYAILVMALWRDPAESVQVMALWIWLERMGHTNVVKKILALPYILINELADEAITCLRCTATDIYALSPDISDIPLLQGLLVKEICLKFFHDNRVAAIQGIAKVVSEVCLRAFSDIMERAVERNAAQNMIDSQARRAAVVQQSLTAPVHPPAGFGQAETFQAMITKGAEVPADDRTMFVTFSKGYLVKEWEVIEFFTRSYGDCIESVHMQEVNPNEQPLFARIVLRTLGAIQVILNGNDKVKFTINGKHVWVRKFVPKRPPRTSMPMPNCPPPGPQPPPPSPSPSFGSFGR